jgi:hypothetical protein
MNHLMVNCPIKKEVWKFILNFIKSQKKWDGGELSENFQIWMKKEDKWSELPCYICWEIWRQRNHIIF